MADIKATSRTKRWQNRMTLLQHALRAQESFNRSRESLDHILRILFEEEEELDAASPATPRPNSKPPAAPDAKPRPSQKPTQLYQPALKSEMFVKMCQRRFQEATREEQRQLCREMVTKGRDNGVIDAVEAAALLKEFSK